MCATLSAPSAIPIHFPLPLRPRQAARRARARAELVADRRAGHPSPPCFSPSCPDLLARLEASPPIPEPDCTAPSPESHPPLPAANVGHRSSTPLTLISYLRPSSARFEAAVSFPTLSSPYSSPFPLESRAATGAPPLARRGAALREPAGRRAASPPRRPDPAGGERRRRRVRPWPRPWPWRARAQAGEGPSWASHLRVGPSCQPGLGF